MDESTSPQFVVWKWSPFELFITRWNSVTANVTTVPACVV